MKETTTTEVVRLPRSNIVVEMTYPRARKTKVAMGYYAGQYAKALGLPDTKYGSVGMYEVKEGKYTISSKMVVDADGITATIDGKTYTISPFEALNNKINDIKALKVRMEEYAEDMRNKVVYARNEYIPDPNNPDDEGHSENKTLYYNGMEMGIETTIGVGAKYNGTWKYTPGEAIEYEGQTWHSASADYKYLTITNEGHNRKVGIPWCWIKRDESGKLVNAGVSQVV